MSSEMTLFNEFNEKRFRKYGRLVGGVFVLGPFDSPIFQGHKTTLSKLLVSFMLRISPPLGIHMLENSERTEKK